MRAAFACRPYLLCGNAKAKRWVCPVRRIPPTEAQCLHSCRGGPLLIVYPEGTWYSGVTSEVCERIIQERLLHGRPVEEYAFHHNPLPLAGAGEGEE